MTCEGSKGLGYGPGPAAKCQAHLAWNLVEVAQTTPLAMD